MGYVIDPTTGALTFNNTPSTTGDLNALAGRVVAVGASSVATVVALEDVEYPRKGEIRRVDADSTYWGFDGAGWELVYRPDEVGEFTFASGVTGVSSLVRTGNVVALLVSSAVRTTAWGVGAAIGTITTASMRPPANVPATVFCSTVGTGRSGWVTIAGVVNLYESTDVGTNAMHIAATWTVAG